MDVPAPQLSGDLTTDVTRYLTDHGCAATADHTRAVAVAAGDLASRFGISRARARTAAWLHDVSAVVPNAERLPVARRWSIPVLPEEQALPMILHQKLSAWMAEHLFGVTDPGVLHAIGCHTTLCAGATPLDQVVFTADKIAWDQAGAPPYLADLEAALARSLSAGACVYLRYLWQRRSTLPVVHPWFAAAFGELCLAAP